MESLIFFFFVSALKEIDEKSIYFVKRIWQLGKEWLLLPWCLRSHLFLGKLILC